MSKIVLNKQNLYYNIDIFKAKFKSIDKIAVVLKDNAYGHGLLEIAKMICDYGINRVVVRSYDEALQLKDMFKFILILSDTDIDNIYDNFHITINSIDNISKIPPFCNVHLKINTKMNRNGIDIDDIPLALELIEKYSLNLCGVFTHHSSAGIDTSKFNMQNQLFNDIKSYFRQNIQNNSIEFHSLNSAGAIRIDEKDFDDDFIRVGIAIYGYNLSDIKSNISFKPVMSLYADKISTQHIKQGETIGYDDSFIAHNDMVVSTYDIGYGDGFFRLKDDKFILPNGSWILGKVSMDSISVNSAEDEIKIFDDVSYLARHHQTIEYEILVALKPNIKRVIKDDL